MSDVNFSALDHHFSRFLANRSGLSGLAGERFQNLVARVSMALGEGHSCLPVSEDETRFLSAVACVSDGGRTPLVLHRGRLYLHRYFHYETRLARQICNMAAINLAPNLDAGVVDSFFDEPNPDWQKEAAKVALSRALTIICGGPGTGKTTTVVKILALLLQESEGAANPAIALAAPTGKAAMRLSEAVGQSLTRLPLADEVKKHLPTGASTLHRLLGVRRGSPQFRHNSDNPMGWDVVVVDEASMVDLAMMSKLVDAMKPGARLILLGDKDQLASVESGAVLGDFVESLPENTVELKKTYRFEKGIKQLAEAINTADCALAWRLLTDVQHPNISLLGENLIPYASDRFSRFMTMMTHCGEVNLQEVFKTFQSFRVLCALHRGRRGAEVINRQVELALARRGFPCRPESWYPGRPVLITRNDYGLNLFNGDVGICLAEREGGDLRVWFETTGGGWRSFPPSRLPGCETVFAMSIHKSQGSEFDEVAVVLPEEDNRILSRELVYTAVTRAKKAVRLVAENEILRLALGRTIERVSGLADMLSE